MYLDHESDGAQMQQGRHTDDDGERKEEIGAGHIRADKADRSKTRVHNVVLDHNGDNKTQRQHKSHSHPP